MKFDWAPQAFRALNGVFCVYKPAGVHYKQVAHIIRNKLVEDLNKLPCYKYERQDTYTMPESVQTVGSTFNSTLPIAQTSVPAETADLSEHRLVLGARYIDSDIRLNLVSPLDKHSSGVQIMGIGKGRSDARIIEDGKFLRVYHVTGQLGMATDNFSPVGKIVERTTYHHVKKFMIDKICASSQASHSKLVFDYARLDPQSQDAYELASQGLIRPGPQDTPPVLYGIKCMEFDLPDFKLEIHSINESGAYFRSLINDIGVTVRSTAVCPQIQRRRYGHFELSHALLRKHWTVEHILENIEFCRDNLEIDKLLPGELIGAEDTLQQLLPGKDNPGHSIHDKLAIK